MTSSCTCHTSTSYGPGLRAAHYLYQGQIRAERTVGGQRFRARRSDFHPITTLSYLAGLVNEHNTVRLDVAAASDDLGRTYELLVAELQWLAGGNRFLRQEGFVGGVMKLCLNPAAACDGGADPRPIAARHRFPYPVLADGGLSAPEPVRFLKYSAPFWEELYAGNQKLFDLQRYPDPDCRHCFPPVLRLV
ncbi:hypothetical protein [Kitasatospora griseola]|uniref:hypothetical protein n=1 Tax=Kitasatospora griseola TaxID=2064 RepID=UPI0034281111